MYLFFICVAVFILVFIIIMITGNTSFKHNPRKIILHVFGNLMLSIVVGAVLFFIAGNIAGAFLEKEQVKDGYTKLYSMGDVFGSGGNFFLGSGNLETRGYYFYYYKSGKGHKQGKVEADGATIIQDNSEVPRIQYYKEIFVNDNHYKWALHSFADGQGGCRDNEKDIFVPKGSIEKDYNFDLKN